MKYSLYKGIIYRIFNAGQADKVIHLVTNKGEKISAMAKGARKSGSRKAASIELGNRVNMKVVNGYAVPIVSELELLEEHAAWKKDMKKMVALQMLCEVTSFFAVEGHAEETTYELLHTALNTELEDIDKLLGIFIFKHIQNHGGMPDISSCLKTEEPLDSESVYEIIGEIGFISDGSTGELSKVPPRVYKAERFFELNNLHQSMRISLSTEESSYFLKQMIRWLEITTERELKSKNVYLSI